MLRRLLEALCYVFAGPETHSARRYEIQAELADHPAAPAYREADARHVLESTRIPEQRIEKLREEWDKAEGA